MAKPSLEQSRAKTQRAKEHFRDLLIKANEFSGLNPYGVVIDENPETGERVWRARVSRQIPIEWSMITGDVVHNLRAALDFLAWQLVIANGRTPDSNTYFPIRRPLQASPPPKAIRDYQAKEKRQIESFGETAMAIIERLQPDPRRYSGDVELHPLWLLHQLDIWDKHKLLNIVGGTVRLSGLTIGGPGEDVHIDRMVIGGGDVRVVPIADGTELLRLKLGDDTPNVKVEEQFQFYIAFEQGGPGKGEPVLPTCDNLISFIDQSITLFAPLFS